uniref:Transposable element protein, putative, Transposase_28 n=1 Tax=Oryza sativa subsp. japonica TaxID=39947 RepID=Q2QQK8_ORYSJ|nr:Transposable element protein, putative, Transposase_28 [Oryza sativa Japonica Group]
MAPRKPNPASAKGPDPGRVDDDSTAFLGVSLVDDVELAKLVSSGALVEGQAFAPGKAVVPKPVDNRTVVFAVFVEAGLRFPCNVLLPEIFRLFQVELPQLSPSALVRISIFDWACRTSGFEPSAELFGAIFFATLNSKTVITPAGTKKTVFGSVNFNVRPERSNLWPVNAAMSKWDRHWMARWFYHTIPFAAGSDSAKALRCRHRAIAPNRKPKIAMDGAMEARFILLRKVCSRLSCRDLVEEFCMLCIFPLSQSWQVTVEQCEEANGLPNLVLPEGTNRPSRKRMRGQVKLAPRKRRVPASSDSDADDEDDAEECDGEGEGEEEEEVEAVADKAANEAIEDRVDTPGYTPTPSPGHNETRVESNSSPLQRKDLEGAKALVAFSSGKAAKGGLVKKISKKKGLVDIARVFSDDESSDETPTSPAGRSLDLSTAHLAPLGVARAGGSAAAGASASAERIVSAAARVFGSPVREPAISPLVKAKGKCVAAEASASEYSLAAPHFVPGDFVTQADLIPFVEGVSNLVLPAGTPSLFTELNEFDEGCSTIKSLAVRILATHCSTERTVRARFDGFKSRLRAKDDEISRKNLEVESLAHTLKEPKTEVKRLQSELDKGKDAWAEVDRLKAELEKEKAHSAVLIDYYNLTEPKMEALRQKASRVEAGAAEESQRFLREMAKTTESARTACQTLRLALTDMGAKFWQNDGRSAAKARLLEQLAKAEAADRGEGEGAAGEEVGGDAQDHPEGVHRKLCIRSPSGSWRSQNEKFVALKDLPKVRCPFRPVYREMEINGHSYKVFKVADWLRAHPGRILEDYDLVHSRRLEDMARFWRNHQKTKRQEMIFQRRNSLVCVSPPTPLKVVYDISSDDEPSSSDHSLGRDNDYRGEDVIYL